VPDRTLGLIAGLLLATTAAWPQAPSVSIGVVVDGPGEVESMQAETVKDEIRRLLQGRHEIRFAPEHQITSDWTAAGVRSAVDRLLAESSVDIVLTTGVLGSNDAAQRPSLAKPVISSAVIEPELQGAPVETRRGAPRGGSRPTVYQVSGRKNLSYTALGHNLGADVGAFREIVSIDRLAVLVMQPLLDALPRLEDAIRERLADQPFAIEVVGVDRSYAGTLQMLSPRVDAVYITPIQHLDEPLEDLVRLLQERRLPSFTMSGRPMVERGLLAGMALEQDSQRLARRTALNLQAILAGDEASELPVDFDRDRRLTLNMATAEAIGVFPTWSVLTEAELIDAREESQPRKLSLGETVRQAGQVNLDIAVADRTVAAGLQRVRESRSNLGPQFQVSARDAVIDRDRAQSSFGAVGQNQVAGSLTFTQILYSEQARAGYDIERNLQGLREQERSQVRLDVILEASTAYLTVLRAKSIERIQRENLELTRRNLERSRSRRELGAAGPGEVYRWESQIADNRKDLIAAIARRNQAEIQVNRTLNHALEDGFDTAEASLDDPEIAISYERLRRYIDNRQGFRIFRRFLAAEAENQSPELAQFDAAIQAQERSLLAAKRAFYVPTVAAQADLTAFHNQGAGSTSPLEGVDIPNFELSSPNNLNWSVGVSASLPLFQGGRLRAQRSRAEIELDERTVEREAVRQRVEQRVRSAAHQAMGSWAGIDLAQQAAEAARSNFDVVADAYEQGAVDIVRLLDAQNQALGAELAAANAVYEFLLDLMAVERAVGRFDYFRSVEDREAFVGRLEAYYREAGYSR